MIFGETFGSYEISRKIGEGGMGEVYLAEHKHMGRKAAIKVLRPKYSSETDLVERFFTEARSVSLVEHPGIVRIYDCAIHTDGRAYIVMEHLEGQTLGSALEQVGCIDDMHTIIDLSWQIANALQAAHDRGIIHRDLKPDNIFLACLPDREQELVVKILDFGVAKLAHSTVKATQTGSLLGTPLYMSPEQALGSGLVDHRTDIYALGCIMFEMTTGRPPFVREGAGALIVAHTSEKPPLASKIKRSMPPELDQLIDSMLAKRPEQRPQSMRDVSSRLSLFLGRTAAVAATDPLIPGLDDGQTGQFHPPTPTASENKPKPRTVAPTEILPPDERERLVPRSIIQKPMATEHSWIARVHQTSVEPAPRRREVVRRPEPSTTLSSAPAATTSSPSPQLRPSAPIFPYIRSGLVVGGLIVLAIAIYTVVTRPKPAENEAPSPTTPTAGSVEPAVALPKLAFSPPAPTPPSSTPNTPPSTAAQAASSAEPEKTASPPRRQPADASRTRKALAAEALKASGAAFDRGDFGSSAKLAKLAVKRGVGVRGYVQLGRAKFELKLYQEALEAYRAALDLDPDNAMALLGVRAIKVRTSP
jgi:serine/threonine protein kinase